MTKLFIVLSIGLLLVSVFLVFLFASDDKKFNDFGFELAKLTAQLLLIAFFGGILLQEYNRKRERKEARNEFRKSILKDLHGVYTDIKKSRRNLRAMCSNQDSKKFITRSDYRKEMANINDTQLRLEVILLEIETYSEAFSEKEWIADKNGNRVEVLKLWNCVKIMEKYLSEIVKEYEAAAPSNGDQTPLDCTAFSKMNEFIQNTRDSGKNTPFHLELAGNFKKSLEIIRAENLKI